MGWGRYLRRRWWDEERAREIEAHLALATDENLARGMTPEAARAAALRKFGNPARVREEIYFMNSLSWPENALRDLRHGARLLRLNPGFTLVAVLSLSLGIGANAAIFQLLDALRLRSLPVAKPQELAEVRIIGQTSRTGSFNGRYPQLTYAQWEQIREHQEAFSGVLAWSAQRFNLSPGGEERYAQGMFVSGDFFRVLGVTPALGRVLNADEDRRGCGLPGAVISHSFWQREFQGSPTALGSKLLLNGHPVEVIGVTPPNFFGVEVGRTYDVAVPLCAEAVFGGTDSRLDRRQGWWLAALGRLKPGWSPQRAGAHLEAISPAIFEATVPETYRPDDVSKYLGFKLTAVPGGSGFSSLRANSERPLWVLLAITGLVLLIACANLANLLLARASARERELAIRLALGASRGRLVRQLLAESLLLAALGAALGAALAQLLSRFLVASLATQGNQLFLDLDPNWRVFGFIAGLAILTCLLFGLTPALGATRTSPGAALKAGGRGLAGSGGSGLRRLLVVSQVALSLLLLVGALLFVRSFQNLATLDAGFRREGLLAASLDLRRADFPAERLLAVQRDLTERLRALPGVESAAEVAIVPMSGSAWNNNIRIDGSAGQEGSATLSNFNQVGPGYFRTMGTPLLGGRDFDERDAATSPKVAIVNETFSRRFLNGANPVGRRFRIEVGPKETDHLYEIIGLVKDTKYRSLREELTPIAFLAAAQDDEPGRFAQFVLRSPASLGALTAAVKKAVAEVNPAIGIQFQSVQTQIWETLLQERLMAMLSSFFGFLAGLLAMIGLYGVISYAVSRRTNEIGIRMALGADRRVVVRLILREAVALLSVGLAAGVLLSLASVKTVSSMLFGLQPYDPVTIGLAVAILAGVGLAASYLPARRAAGVDPMEALRAE